MASNKLVPLLLLLFVISESLLAQNNHKVAVLLSDKAMDFGFNYMINDGAIKAQRHFNMTHIHVLENVKPDILNSTIERLIEEGYHGIFASSIEMVRPAMYYASQNPQVRFLGRSGTYKNTTNLSLFTYNIGIAYYIIGMFAGLMTKSGNIGFIGPGMPLLANYNANAMFVGARYAKRTDVDVKLTYINTNSWIDEDVVAGGTQTLIDTGIDYIGNNQDDMTAAIMMIKNGHMGLGTNGFPQSKLYGQAIGTSIINDWSQVIINFIDLIVNDSPFSRKDYGDFGNGFLKLDNYSFMVPDAVKQAIQTELDRLSKYPVAQHPYFCNEYNPKIFPWLNETNNCINTSTFFSMNTPYPGMDYLGEYKVPLVQVKTNRSVEIGIIVVSAVLIALCFAMLGGVIHYKDSHSIRSASPIFCLIIIIGGIMTYAGAIFYALSASDALCNLRYWLLALGYSTLAGSLVVKNFRIWLIFDNPELKKIKITNGQLMPWVGGINLIVFILLVLMAVPQLGNLRMQSEHGPTDFLEKYEYQNVCSFSRTTHGILYVLLGVFAALIMVGVFVSWKIRIVDLDEFNESKPIANSLYAALFSVFVIVPLLVVPHSATTGTIIICSAALFITTMTLAILFIPKFYRIYAFGTNSSDMFSSAKSAIAESRTKSKESGSANFEYNSHDSDDSSEIVICAPEGIKPAQEAVHAQFDSDEEDDPKNQANHNLSIDHSSSSSGDENNNNNNNNNMTTTTTKDV